MALLEDISLRLDNQGRGTRGTNLFIGRSPDDPDNVVVIWEMQGQEPYNSMGHRELHRISNVLDFKLWFGIPAMLLRRLWQIKSLLTCIGLKAPLIQRTTC